MSARDARNRFGELLDVVQREPVVVTQTDGPVGVILATENDADRLRSKRLLDEDPRYDGARFNTFSATLARVDSGEDHSHHSGA